MRRRSLPIQEGRESRGRDGARCPVIADTWPAKSARASESSIIARSGVLALSPTERLVASRCSSIVRMESSNLASVRSILKTMYSREWASALQSVGGGTVSSEQTARVSETWRSMSCKVLSRISVVAVLTRCSGVPNPRPSRDSLIAGQCLVAIASCDTLMNSNAKSVAIVGP